MFNFFDANKAIVYQTIDKVLNIKIVLVQYIDNIYIYLKLLSFDKVLPLFLIKYYPKIRQNHNTLSMICIRPLKGEGLPLCSCGYVGPELSQFEI
jgi:hypothetical protein